MLNLGRKTDRFLVERFTQWIPGWGIRQLTLDDLGNLCDDCGIVVVETALEEDGLAIWLDGQPFVYINRLLPYAERVITGFHELAHILYHPIDKEVFRRTGLDLWNWSKCDRQAEVVGTVAWMPEPQVRGLSPETLMQRFGVRRESAEFRARLNLWSQAALSAKRKRAS
jgi:Zn-dependent peptidase ImmA (M78 family)